MAKPNQTETSYQAEMEQPIHRPGMERAVVRGTPMGRAMPRMTDSPPNDPRDQNGDRIGPRRQVGEASPAIQERYLDRALEDEPPVESPPKPSQAEESSTEAGSGEAGRAHEAQIMDYVDKAAT